MAGKGSQRGLQLHAVNAWQLYSVVKRRKSTWQRRQKVTIARWLRAGVDNLTASIYIYIYIKLRRGCSEWAVGQQAREWEREQMQGSMTDAHTTKPSVNTWHLITAIYIIPHSLDVHRRRRHVDPLYHCMHVPHSHISQQRTHWASWVQTPFMAYNIVVGPFSSQSDVLELTAQKLAWPVTYCCCFWTITKNISFLRVLVYTVHQRHLLRCAI